jgi:hypothetical protein
MRLIVETVQDVDMLVAKNERAFLYDSGKVDINTTLRVNQKYSQSATHNFEIDATNVAGGRLIVNTDGEVGIGKTDPSYVLDIVNATPEMRIGTSAQGGGVL